MKNTLILIALALNTINLSYAQNSQGLSDGRTLDECRECEQKLTTKPKEVLFGIHFSDGQIYFLVTNEAWFYNFLTQPTDGIAVEIVSKDQFACGKDDPPLTGWAVGTVLKPIYLAELKRKTERLPTGGIRILVQSIPDELKNKEIEGNLIIVRKTSVCHKINFTKIERSLWNLLDMGLYTDSLINQQSVGKEGSSQKNLFYNKSVKVIVPFAKGKSTYLPADVKPLYDSLNLKGFVVKKIDIRAFSSVEGPIDINLKLQQQRAQTIISAIQTYQSKNIKQEVSSGENWVEFMQDISKTSHKYLSRLTKDEIKKKIDTNKPLHDSLETILAKHRKAIITIYLDGKNEADNTDNKSILESFNKSIAEKNIAKAAAIQRSIFDRVSDNQLPSGFLDQLQIPSEKQFSTLLNDKQVYKFLLKESSESQAIRQLKRAELLDPTNGKIKYNINALQLRLWQYDDSLIDRKVMLKQITDLAALGIRPALIKRMIINYKIILCEIYMKDSRYDLKDQLLAEIKNTYQDITITDQDLLSLGKYFCQYAQYKWAEDILYTRMDKLDVDENLLFFYLNLCIFEQKNFQDKTYNDMLLNAISINNKRVCNFFNAIDNGGISMQLLLQSFWKNIYCDNCRL